MIGAPSIVATEVIEIRSRRDRNRLLATYDPERGVLRLFHRGEIITVQVGGMDGAERQRSGIDT